MKHCDCQQLSAACEHLRDVYFIRACHTPHNHASDQKCMTVSPCCPCRANTGHAPPQLASLQQEGRLGGAQAVRRPLPSMRWQGLLPSPVCKPAQHTAHPLQQSLLRGQQQTPDLPWGRNAGQPWPTHPQQAARGCSAPRPPPPPPPPPAQPPQAVLVSQLGPRCRPQQRGWLLTRHTQHQSSQRPSQQQVPARVDLQPEHALQRPRSAHWGTYRPMLFAERAGAVALQQLSRVPSLGCLTMWLGNARCVCHTCHGAWGGGSWPSGRVHWERHVGKECLLVPHVTCGRGRS